MSFYTFTPKTFSSCEVEIDNLSLEKGGFGGMFFTGYLNIEPDSSLYGEDWYVAEAYALNEDGETYTLYSSKKNPEMFKAICKAVDGDYKVQQLIIDYAQD